MAEKLTLTPTKMVEEDWQPLRALGFSDRDCLEVGHLVGAFNYFTRLADGFGLRLDAGTRRAAETQVPLARG
ncbi:MAG: carboxymuconolactone decarboxylase family protein [Candidatus Binatia bacterium]